MLIVNWVSIWTGTNSGNGTVTLAASTRILSWLDWVNYPASMIVDEAIVENRVWTAAEIQKYYTYALWRFTQ